MRSPNQIRALRSLLSQERAAERHPGAFTPGLVRGQGRLFSRRTLGALARQGLAEHDGLCFQLTAAGRAAAELATAPRTWVGTDTPIGESAVCPECCGPRRMIRDRMVCRSGECGA